MVGGQVHIVVVYTSGIEDETENCEITWYSLTYCEIIKDLSAWSVNARYESTTRIRDVSGSGDNGETGRH